nr:immunoglobulin heavy chain junction region [Macaca mulatta]MOV58568.1 immunoglobulin heavy chain junction region [Macaca mulatta]MOV60452.1 immunoglobulin heavy chain junction region [Macaca mulatta]MOV60592.1 immunoglobulin heavy chain junction region [Macaca mulatta]MOW45556.1 immunoglobulin heavy chain junction region [Macaca mulatta]
CARRPENSYYFYYFDYW